MDLVVLDEDLRFEDSLPGARLVSDDSVQAFRSACEAITTATVFLWHHESDRKSLETISHIIAASQHAHLIRCIILFRGYLLTVDRPLLDRLDLSERVYVLPEEAHTNNLSSGLISRLKRFQEVISGLAPQSPVPIGALAPPFWPEYVVAAYLACIAAPYLSPHDAQAVLASVDWTALPHDVRTPFSLPQSPPPITDCADVALQLRSLIASPDNAANA